MKRVSPKVLREFADRETLDEIALGCYYRCREAGYFHSEAMQLARDDMSIRRSVARRQTMADRRSVAA